MFDYAAVLLFSAISCTSGMAVGGMRWTEEKDPRYLHMETLRNEEGKAVGWIGRFYRCGPTYAYVNGARIGPCSGPEHPEHPDLYIGTECDAAARTAIEKRIAGL